MNIKALLTSIFLLGLLACQNLTYVSDSPSSFCALLLTQSGIGYFLEHKSAFDWMELNGKHALVYVEQDNVKFLYFDEHNWNEIQLPTPQKTRHVAWEPNSKSLAFGVGSGGHHGGFILDPATETIEQFHSYGRILTWSSSGHKLAFYAQHKVTAGYATHILNIDSQLIDVPLPKFQNAIPQDWSPNDEFLALIISQEGYEKLAIYDVQANSLEIQFADTASCEEEIDWASTSNLVAFQRTIEGRSDIVVFNYPEDSETNVTNSADIDEFHPAISPDGQYLAYVEATRDKTDNFSYPSQDLILVDLLTGQKTNLTNTPKQIESRPKWSTDGTMLAFATQEPSSSSRYVDVIELDSMVRSRVGQLDKAPSP